MVMKEYQGYLNCVQCQYAYISALNFADVNDWKSNAFIKKSLHSYSYIVVIVNASPTEVSFTSSSVRARTLQLHPVQVIVFCGVSYAGNMS